MTRAAPARAAAAPAYPSNAPSWKATPIEPHRPVLHFSPRRNWINDPNGLVFHKGIYHLFFQYNPEGHSWGNMSWGHATSPDLVTWTEHPIAIPYTPEEGIFSGSVVADVRNTSGLGTAEQPPLVALYTSAYTPLSGRAGLQAQSLAYSVDDGLTWTRHAGNPVLDLGLAHFRDPKVFWFEPTQDWRMVLALPEERQVAIYRSPNLTDWTRLSTFGPLGATEGVWECPDLIPLDLDGDPARTRWVMIVSLTLGAVAGGSGTQYFVGRFDGTTFVPDTDVPDADVPDTDVPGRAGEGLGGTDGPYADASVAQPAAGDGAPAPAATAVLDGAGTTTRWLDHGRDNYAGVTFSDAPGGRRILVGWMSNWQYAADVPTAPVRGQLTLPRELSLVSAPGGPRLVQTAVAGVAERIRADERWRAPTGPVTGERTLAGVSAEVAVIDLAVDLAEASAAGLVVRRSSDGSEGTVVTLHADPPRLTVDRTRSGAVAWNPHFASVQTAPLVGTTHRVRIYLDRSSVEVAADGGQAWISDLVFPEAGSTGVSLFAEDGAARLLELTVTPVRTQASSGGR